MCPNSSSYNRDTKTSSVIHGGLKHFWESFESTGGEFDLINMNVTVSLLIFYDFWNKIISFNSHLSEGWL